nr:homoserine O-acetyltransferase [Actinomycetales bacterium]
MRALIDPRSLPATGAWREGDPVGRRLFEDLGLVTLESGTDLPVTVAYETWGELATDGSNAVLVLHALTGDSHVQGPAEAGHASAGWWEAVVGPGPAIDTDRWFVVAPNILGGCQGTTGPASPAEDGKPYGSRFPFVTARDQATVEALLADRLGIQRFALVIGSSMGGQRALEWAIMFPDRVARLAVIASNAATTARQVALAHTQLLAIESDPHFRGGDYYDAPVGEGPGRGLSLARQIAHISYRADYELAERFSRLPQHAEEPLEGGRYAVQSYLDHAGWKLVQRFDANSYRVITHAMMTHDVGRDRGGVETALRQIEARVMVLGVDTDELFLPEELMRIVRGAPGAVPIRWISSPHGHDGFLVQHDQVSEHVHRFLTAPERARLWL